MIISLSELLRFYYKNLLKKEQKNLGPNEIAEFCFFYEEKNKLVLTHYWLHQIFWPLSLLIIYTSSLLYLSITEVNFFVIDLKSKGVIESLSGLAIIFLLIIIWGTIALVGRTTLVLTSNNLVLLEKPFLFLSSKYKTNAIKNFEIKTQEFKSSFEIKKPNIFYGYVTLNTIDNKNIRILTFRSRKETENVHSKLTSYLNKFQS